MATLTTNEAFAGMSYISLNLGHSTIPFTSQVNVTAPAAAVYSYPQVISDLTHSYEIGNLVPGTQYTYTIIANFSDGTSQTLSGQTITTRPATYHLPIKTKVISLTTAEISVKQTYPDFFDNTVGRTLFIKPLGGNVSIRFNTDQGQVTLLSGTSQEFYPAQEVFLQGSGSMTVELTLSSRRDKAN
jgi:hypothetical protein